MLQQLTEVFDKHSIDDGSRSSIDIEIDYQYNRYRKTGKLEEERLRCWFYMQTELYRYGIKNLLYYRLDDLSQGNVYREMFTLKDLTIRGYFFAYVTDLPIQY